MENLPVAQLRNNVARCCRALHAVGLVDLTGQVSARVRDADNMVITPRPDTGTRPLNIIDGDDILVMDLDGGVVEGRGRPPAGYWLHSEIYKRRPDVGGIVHTHQKMATAFGIASREIRPLITQGAEITVRPIPIYQSAAPVNNRERGRAVADTLGNAKACHLQGHGIVVAAESAEAATMLAHGLEDSAAMNFLALPLGSATAIAPESVERHLRDRLRNPPGGAPQFHFYQSIDSGPRPLPALLPVENDLQRLRHDTALACHILYHFGLVRSLEHVSIRIPGTDRFTFSPSLNMGRIQPGEIAVMDLQGNFLEGPTRPPLYIWAFIEIYRARPDVRAIVHTHERYGRAFAITGRAIQPLQRDGAYLFTRDIPIHESSDLLYDAERGRAFARTLGTEPVVHSRGHGTEYVAGTIQECTNWAVLLEKQAEMNHLACQLGTPRVLPANVASDTAGEGPAPEVWWQYYRTLVAAPS